MFLNPGVLYLFERHLCFYSKSMGDALKVTLAFRKMVLMKKAKSLGMIQNAIKLYMEKNIKYFFKQLKHRDSVYEKIH